MLTGGVLCLLALLIMAGGMFLTVLYAQLLGSYSALWIGLILAPCAGTTFILAPIVGTLSDRLGARPLVVVANVAAGAGVGLATPALVRTAIELVERTQVEAASGLYKTMNELGGVFGVVLLGSFLETRIVANALKAIPGHMLPADLNLKTLSSLKDLEVLALQRGLLPAEVSGFHQAIQDAVARGFKQVFWTATAVAVLGMIAAVLVPGRTAQRRGIAAETRGH